MIFGMEPVMSRANLIRKSEIVRRVVRAHTYYFGEDSVSTKVANNLLLGRKRGSMALRPYLSTRRRFSVHKSEE